MDIKSQGGVVFFFDNSAAKCSFLSPRFKVGLELPELTKLYFKPDTFWNNEVEDFNGKEVRAVSNYWVESVIVSDVLHGMSSNIAPGTRPVTYDPPYFLVFKIQGVSSNYLSFTDYQKPNSESTILALLRYDENKLMLKDECSTEMILPYEGDLCLNEVLEFTLYDSANRIVQVSDKSQLFILLTIL